MSGAKIILDTNVASYLMRGGTLAETYLPHVQGKLLAIAFILRVKHYQRGEIGRGVEADMNEPRNPADWSRPQ